ncbi:MAG: hypothetical protein LBU78_02325 [Microbacterium sp.]|jgi:hypothetical protein|nr:hypothetical protein [Microbacterium sp.]
MTENRSPAALVGGVHRRIRVLDPQEGPFQGELVVDGEDVRVRVDAAGCADEPFWAFSGAGHVAAPLDLIRRADGTDVLLPWCTERVAVFLGRRVAEQTLGTGESVTLVGSLLRGVVELDASPLTGTWWLTDGGRPVFVLGAGEPASESARALVARVRASAANRSLERLLADHESGLADPRAARRRMDRWEAELTELAAPRPLRREVFAPAAAAAVMEDRFTSDVGGLEDQGWRTAAAARLGIALDRGRALLHRVLRPGRGASESASELPAAPKRTVRRRPLLVGLAAALVVLAGGLLWPSGDADEPASAQTGGGSAATRTSPAPRAEGPSPDATQEEPPDAESTDDPIAAATALLKRIDGCVRDHDERCADAVVEGSASSVLTAVQDTDAGDAVALVDSYGDIAVIRRGGPEERQQILVLLRQKDEWLVRDVYAVADQPGSS